MFLVVFAVGMTRRAGFRSIPCSRVIPELGALAALGAQRECIKSGAFFEILSAIHVVNFLHICFLAQFYYALSACNSGLLLYSL